MVIGPTPPGTGVIQPATSDTEAKSTSPASEATTGFAMPLAFISSIASRTTLAKTIGGVTNTFAYTYDPAGRLSAVTVNGGGTPIATYTYDNNGKPATACFDFQSRAGLDAVNEVCASLRTLKHQAGVHLAPGLMDPGHCGY